MVLEFNIEKRNWERYKIMQKKSCQHQYYGRDRMGKYETGKYGTDMYGHLATFRKSCQCRDKLMGMCWECNVNVIVQW